MGTGWLSPSGEFIECDPHDHWGMAVELVEKLDLSEEDQRHADDFLIEHGWIRISFLLMLDTGYVFSYYEIASESQRLFLRRFLEENQESLSKQGIRNLYWLRVIDGEEREMLRKKNNYE